MIVSFLLTVLCLAPIVLKSECFHFHLAPLKRGSHHRTALSVGFGWFGSSPSSPSDENADRGDPIDIASEKAGVASVMASMDQLKTSQRIGKMTSAVVQDLSNMNVEGVSGNGKVKVTFDCQQLPLSTQIDETFAKTASASDISIAVTEAMRDAHRKSIEKMDEKMKSFFSDLGLPSQR